MISVRIDIEIVFQTKYRKLLLIIPGLINFVRVLDGLINGGGLYPRGLITEGAYIREGI